MACHRSDFVGFKYNLEKKSKKIPSKMIVSIKKMTTRYYASEIRKFRLVIGKFEQ